MDLYEGSRDESMGNHLHYQPLAPDVLVARFGALVIALDGEGLHVALIDPRTVKAS